MLGLAGGGDGGWRRYGLGFYRGQVSAGALLTDFQMGEFELLGGADGAGAGPKAVDTGLYALELSVVQIYL